MTNNRDLTTLIRASTPLLVIETAEEVRVISTFRQAIAQALRPLYRWSITAGLQRLDVSITPDEDKFGAAPDASATLMAIKRNPDAGIYLLLDFQPYLRYSMTLRLLREIGLREQCAAHTLVLIAPQIELPPELEAFATRYSLPLPDAAALAQLVRDEAYAYSRDHAGKPVAVDADAARAVVRNLRGLDLESARRILRQAIYDDGAIALRDVANIMRDKFNLLNKDGLLSFEADTTQFADIAGMKRLKQWIAQRRGAFLGLKSAAGLASPKGVLLLGVQGCGKSLAAKAIAGGLGVPLVRLDFGVLYNKYQGETERNLRDALTRAGKLAPCVLWIDEIEKALATGDSDDGVSRRVLGYLLTWMEERRDAIFLTATANQVRELPPELLRKGRFDETFFVDLPDESMRAEIFNIHLSRRELKAENFDVTALGAASNGFSGAEIEQAIVSAQFAAAADSVAVTQSHVLAALRETRPLSVLMAEPVAALRSWAAGRTVSVD
ncbi:MAG TPA: AAA family ATPase [Rudaea sp.]|nr:AAA family ATPase [Rudaea sp.]